MVQIRVKLGKGKGVWGQDSEPISSELVPIACYLYLDNYHPSIYEEVLNEGDNF